MKRAFFAAALTTCLAATPAAQSSPAAQAARQWRQQHERAIVEEFMALLAIPNISRTPSTSSGTPSPFATP